MYIILNHTFSFGGAAQPVPGSRGTGSGCE